MKEDHRDIAAELIESAVKVIARYGFDKATTRNIAQECGLADAYIYVHFKSKGELFSRAFECKEAEMADIVRKSLPILRQAGMRDEDRLYFVFIKAWMQLLSNPYLARFFVLYYYSPYFTKYSRAKHDDLWRPLMGELKVLFRPDTDMRTTLHPVLHALLSQAVNAAADLEAEPEETGRKNFELAMAMLNDSLACH